MGAVSRRRARDWAFQGCTATEKCRKVGKESDRTGDGTEREGEGKGRTHGCADPAPEGTFWM